MMILGRINARRGNCSVEHREASFSEGQMRGRKMMISRGKRRSRCEGSSRPSMVEKLRRESKLEYRAYNLKGSVSSMRINRGFLTLFCVYIGASLEICVYTTTLLPSLLPDNNVKAGSRSLCYTFAELYGIRECVFRFFGRLLCSLLLYHLDGMGDNSSGDSERCSTR